MKPPYHYGMQLFGCPGLCVRVQCSWPPPVNFVLPAPSLTTTSFTFL
jgi:hypothetical protein